VLPIPVLSSGMMHLHAMPTVLASNENSVAMPVDEGRTSY
jgi:hypothetical protein